MDRCPICNVMVKPENLLRHLNDIHPRHPDTPALLEKLKEEPGRSPRRSAGPPLRIRRWQVLLVAAIVLGGVGAYYLVQFLMPAPSLPCISAEGGRVYHWHTVLTIYSGAAQVQVAANIGLTVFCIEPLHTHDTSGTIHIESDVGRYYSIGDFFGVWRKPFGSPTQMLLNSTAVSPSPNQILYDREFIELHYASFA